MSWWSEGGVWGLWCAGGVGGGGGGGSWAGTVEESSAESEALSNVRVQGQDCRVSTCSPLGPAAQAIINPLSGATACHYSLTCIHTHVHAQLHEHSRTGTCTYTHTNSLSTHPLIHGAVWCIKHSQANRCKHRQRRENQRDTCATRSAFVMYMDDGLPIDAPEAKTWVLLKSLDLVKYIGW